MLKTKHFINFLKSAARHGWLMEKISLIGMISGFGIVAVDWLWARKLGQTKYGLAKRLIILIIAAVILYAFFMTFLSFLFAIPLFAPLLICCLIGFIVLGFGGMMFAMLIGYAGLSIMGLFVQKQMCPSLSPVLPGVPIPGFGVMIPLIAWVSLVMVLMIHEMSHGIMLIRYKEKIKSVGLLLAGIFPIGAFVEQDDQTFNKLEDKKSLMVLSAGPSSNIFSIIIALLLLFFVINPLLTSAGNSMNSHLDGLRIADVSPKISYCGVDKNSPAFGKLFASDQLISINGQTIKDQNQFSFVRAGLISNNTDWNVAVLRGGATVLVSLKPVVFEDLNIKLVGVTFEGFTSYKYSLLEEIGFSLLNYIGQIIYYFWIISFAAGTFNFLPASPLDGGGMAKILLAPYFKFMKFRSEKETRKFVGRLFVWAFLITVLLNLIPYLTMIHF